MCFLVDGAAGAATRDVLRRLGNVRCVRPVTCMVVLPSASTERGLPLGARLRWRCQRTTTRRGGINLDVERLGPRCLQEAQASPMRLVAQTELHLRQGQDKGEVLRDLQAATTDTATGSTATLQGLAGLREPRRV